MNLYWLEQVNADLPRGDDWLSVPETDRLGSLRFPKRRADWRLGRWTAKQGVAFCLSLKSDAPALANIEIRASPSGAPEVFVNHERAPVAISLSHRENRAICAIARSNVRVGCDLEAVEPRSNTFVAEYFTTEEQQLLGTSYPCDRHRMVALLWSAKESALKALGEGMRLDIRSVTVSLGPKSSNAGIWGQLQLRCGHEVFRGWWQEADNFVRTIATDPPCNTPIRLPVASALDQGVSPELPASAM